ISALTTWEASVGVGATPRYSPTSSASSGNARPEKSMRLFLLSPIMLAIDLVLPAELLACSITRRTGVGDLAFLRRRGRLGRGGTLPAPQHPVVEDALRAGRHGQCTGRYV